MNEHQRYLQDMVKKNQDGSRDGEIEALPGFHFSYMNSEAKNLLCNMPASPNYIFIHT